MRRQEYTGPTLPKELLSQVGAKASNGRRRNGPAARKHARKAARVEKKQQHRSRPKAVTKRNALLESNGNNHLGSSDEEELHSQPQPSKRRAVEPANAPKPILKKPIANGAGVEEAEASQPKIKPTKTAKSSIQPKEPKYKEDDDIAALEKKLGLKPGKKSRALDGEDDGDGLEDILGNLADDEELMGASSTKRKLPEDEDWLSSKRSKASGQINGDGAQHEEKEDDGGSNDAGETLEDSDDLQDGDAPLKEEDSNTGFDQDEDDFAKFSDDDDDELQTAPEPQRRRENPYLPPVPEGAPVGKYIPPSMRAPAASDVEALSRLRRQTQGLINRLSEANILTILKDVEALYQNNARQHVTSTLIDVLMALLLDRTSLNDTFIIFHAAFISAVYKIVGADFGAQLVERLVADFERFYGSLKGSDFSSKESANIVSLLAELYNFQVIGSNLMFDYVRLLLQELSETNTELLLKVVRSSGAQLRQDDPSALKDIVLLLQKSVSAAGEAHLSVRTKFMIETINNLKNNKMKTDVAGRALAAEHLTRMKKMLGTLNARNIKASEPLRIGLQDLQNTEKKGKWWLVGASWKGNDRETTTPQESKASNGTTTPIDVDDEVIDSGTADLLQLAKEQGMNTDVRRSIFITLLSASDTKHAHLELLKLHLKKTQELEIPRVIIHCAGSEQTYNPYYTLIAKKLCSEHRLKMAFQFGLWGVFKQFGEKEAAAEDDGGDVDDADAQASITTRKIINLAKLFGNLIVQGALAITCLKVLNFPYMQPKTKMFVEVLLVTIMLQTRKIVKGSKRDEDKLQDVISKARSAAQMVRPLQFFLQKVIRKSDIASTKAERETVRWGCEVAVRMLEEGEGAAEDGGLETDFDSESGSESGSEYGSE